LIRINWDDLTNFPLFHGNQIHSFLIETIVVETCGGEILLLGAKLRGWGLLLLGQLGRHLLEGGEVVFSEKTFLLKSILSKNVL
jgi:hypothetical protein